MPDPRLTAAYEALMAERRRELGPEPTPDELVAYLEDRLGDEERSDLEARLVVYPEAARTLVDWAAFPDVEPAPGGEPLGEADVDAAWESFRRQRLSRPGAATAVPVEAPGPRVPRRSLRPLALAATVLLAVGGAFWLGRATGPDADPLLANVAVVPLAHEAAALRGEAEAAELPADAERVLLILDLGPLPEEATYRVTVRGPEPPELAREGLRPDPLGTLHLMLPARSPAGRYEITLSTEGGAQVADYRLELIHPAREAGGGS